MARQLTCQRFIYKIRSERLRKARWNLTLPIAEARKNEELVSLADSQMLRWIDELNGITDADEISKQIKAEIRVLKRGNGSLENRRQIRRLYQRLDEIQFKPDYLCVVMDKKKDYTRACKGFKVNGISYHRLLGTNGGIKNSTIVFVSDRLGDELRRRVENGRDPNAKLVPAKLEAYKALTCSASTPVSMPNGIIVVDDCTTKFLSDIIYLNDENEGEPVLEYRYGVETELDESDGYGLISPELAERWGREIGIKYVPSGMNTRYSFEKGMVFCFPFHEFAEKVAGNYIVKDVWGTERDVREAELILTSSMVKLWDSYPSCEAYLEHCNENKYTFGVTKVCPEELESERNLNYQFLQGYRLSDEDLEELVAPTIDEIHGILHADLAKTILYLKGAGLDDRNVEYLENDFAKALMIEPKLIDDPYVQSRVYGMIKKRINEAKIGVLRVHGNYSIISGDPYALCQHMFGLEVTGLLKAGEVYNYYWAQREAEYLACYRAPMTTMENIRKVRPNRSEEALYWFRYMRTCTAMNAWDTAAAALNGADKHLSPALETAQ